MARPKQLAESPPKKKKGVSTRDYKNAKRQAFMIWLGTPGVTTRSLAEQLKPHGYEIHYATISKWINDDEWNRWFEKTLGDATKTLKIKAVKLYDDAISFCDRALKMNLDEDEVKCAAANTKIVSMLFEHAGLINQKPFMEIHNNNLTQINNSNNVTPELIESMTTVQVNDYLFSGKIPDVAINEDEEDEFLISEDDIIKINR